MDNVTSMLAAEYSYWILCVSCLHKLNPPTMARIKNLCKIMKNKEFNEYTRMFGDKITEMKEALYAADESGYEPIKVSDFIEVVDHYQKIAKDAFSGWEQKKHKLPEHVKRKATEFWPMFMKVCLFLGPEELEEQLEEIEDYIVEDEDNERLKDALEKIEFRTRISSKSVKHNIVNKIETFSIINNLINPTRRDVEGKVKGAMNVIKVTKNVYGDEMYRTLCIARRIAFGDRDFPFEIVRHYGNHNLVDINVEDRNSASGRILAQIQQKSCHNRWV